MADFNQIKLATTVDLNYEFDGNKPVYHLIYASQLYGSVFAIYGRFEGNKNENSYSVTKITLALLNYKGIINIGFTENDFRWENIQGEDNFFFGVRGTSIKVDHPVLIENPLVVRKGIALPLILNRTIYPLPGFEDYLNEGPGQQTVVPPILPFFDTEFNDRDGLDFYNQDLKPGMLGYDGSYSLIASPRCIQSNLRLIY